MSDRAQVAALAELRSAVAGPVQAPSDDGYSRDIATFDLTMRYRPHLAVSPLTSVDVAGTLAIAARHRLSVAVLGTGHAGIGPADADVLIRTGRLAGIRVDPESATATVGAGTTWRQVIAETGPLGLAPLCGSAPDVGVIGLLVGGGMGPVGRTYGFTADHVRSLQVVTAAGEILRVDAQHHSELFWALRGGKGGLAVVTAATLELIPLHTIYGGGLFFGTADAEAVLHGYTSWVNGSVPETLTTSLAMVRFPPLPEVPEPLRGRFVLQLRVGFVGTLAEGEDLIAPLRTLGSPLLDTVGDMPYSELGSIHNDPVFPLAISTGGMLLGSFDHPAADAVLAAAGPGTHAPLSLVELRHMGGALGRPAAQPNAVGGRDASFSLFVVSKPITEPSQDTVAAYDTAVCTVLDALRPWGTGGTQVNFFGSVNPVHEFDRCWPSATAARLAMLRNKLDPYGLFAFEPAHPGETAAPRATSHAEA